MKDVIVVNNLCKRFKRYPTRGYTTLKDLVVKRQLFKMRQDRQYIEALRNVTFSVPESTVLGIIGPNGSGKSTLLKLLAGIYRPDSGKLSVRGRISALLSLGVGFHPDLTGRENIMIGGLSLGISRGQVRQAFDEIVDFAELEDFIDAPVRTYSSGMYARLAFSIAVHVNPDILLLDEVLAVGDASFIKKSRARMDKFKEQGKTILYVTHDLAAVEAWCHQALWLNNGGVFAMGDPKDVVARYRAESLASAPA
jgi:ABC-type polysaccharide/polyol phosphate transport system ATPase subunit